MSSSNLRTAALVQFYQFHKLPFELRQLIGQFSLPERCYVQVFGPCWQLACSPSCTLCRRPQDDSWRLERERRFPISSEEDPRKKRTRYEEQVGPESLRTCRKSREETLRHYIPLFKDGSKLRTIYFSPARDVVDIGNGRLEDLHKFLFAAGDFSTEMQEQLNLVKRESQWQRLNGVLGRTLYSITDFGTFLRVLKNLFSLSMILKSGEQGISNIGLITSGIPWLVSITPRWPAKSRSKRSACSPTTT